jgi:RNA polymerase-binding transcription factor DksA
MMPCWYGSNVVGSPPVEDCSECRHFNECDMSDYLCDLNQEISLLEEKRDKQNQELNRMAKILDDWGICQECGDPATQCDCEG